MNHRPGSLLLRLAAATLLCLPPLHAPAQQAHNIEVVGQIGGICHPVDVVGNYAYIGEGPNLKILDISNPSQPLLVGRLLLPYLLADVFVSSGTAYIVDRDFRIVDVSKPYSPKLLSVYSTPQPVGNFVYVSDNVAYVADPVDGVRIIDVSNSSSPTLLGTYDMHYPDHAQGLFVIGDLAYVATLVSPQGGALQIVDVSNPFSPTLLGRYDTGDYSYDVHVSGDLAYVASGESGLQIVDVSSPSLPVLRGSCDTPGRARSVCVAGQTAYVADGTRGLQVIDVADPSRPELRGSYDTPGFVWSVDTSGTLVCLPDWDVGLHIIDASDPSSPTLCNVYPTIGNATSAWVRNSLVYVGVATNVGWLQSGGLQIIDATYPEWPRFLGSCSLPMEARAVHVSGTMAYVAMFHDDPWGRFEAAFKSSMSRSRCLRCRVDCTRHCRHTMSMLPEAWPIFPAAVFVF